MRLLATLTALLFISCQKQDENALRVGMELTRGNALELWRHAFRD